MRTTLSTVALASILALAGALGGCQTQQVRSGTNLPINKVAGVYQPGATIAERRAAGYDNGGFATDTPNNNGRNNAEQTVPDDNLGSGTIKIGLNYD
jgi:hypothetical protein